MNRAVYVRTLRDQLRVRTYVFIVFLALAGFFAAWGGGTVMQEIYGADPGEDRQEELDKMDGAAALALFLDLPVVNGKFFLILFALLMSASTVAKEWQDKTVFLLFSKPVPRWQIVVAKVLGVYTWVVVGVLVAALAIIIGGAAAGVDRPAPPAFFVGVAWMVFGMLPFVAIPSFIAFLVRRPIPSVVLSVFMVAVVAPLASQSGFVAAMQDEDFRALGLYDPDWDDGEHPMDACYSYEDNPFSPRPLHEAESEEELDEAYAALEAELEEVERCRGDAIGDVDRFYTSRGAPREKFQYEWSWCELDAVYQAWDGQGDEPAHNRTQPDLSACWEYDTFQDRVKREAAFMTKFERPLVDAPRYLSPTSVLSGWELLAGWKLDEDAPAELSFILGGESRALAMQLLYEQNGVGAGGKPASVAGSVFGVVLNSVLWIGLAVLVTYRRDLS